MFERKMRRFGTRGVLGLMAIAGVAALAATLSAGAQPLGSGTAGTHPAVTGNSCKVGTSPTFDAYNPVNHEVYVPNEMSHNLSILKGCSVVATVTFSNSLAQPISAAFDPSNNHVYVTDLHLNRVYVISGQNVTKTITNSMFNGLYGIAYDPGDGVMAAANSGANDVVFITSSSTILGTNTVGLEPRLIGYDPFYARLLVTNFGSENVTSIDAVYPTVQGNNVNIPVGTSPFGIAFDYQTDQDYVANEASQNITVFFGIATGGHGDISLGPGNDPAGVVWDQAKLSIYVADQLSGNVSIIKGTAVVRTIVGPMNSDFVGIAYDDATDRVYVTDHGSGLVYVYD
jgi:DNA-binding beta-propeller fold protein YncE